MIRNRYNYLTPSVQDTKGKEGRALNIIFNMYEFA